MAVAQHPVISDPTHGSILPPHWRTLDALRRIPAERLKKLLADGTIDADTERKDAERIARATDPERVIEALRTLQHFRKDWPDPANLVADIHRHDDIDGDDTLSASKEIGDWLLAIGTAWRTRQSDGPLKPSKPCSEEEGM